MKRAWNQLTKLVVLSVLMLTSTLVVLPAMHASAGLNDGYCDNNEICIYKNSNLGTPRSDYLYFYKDMSGCPDCHTYNYPKSCNTTDIFSCLLNDSVSSMDSWSDHRRIRFFTSKNFDGNRETMEIFGRQMHAVWNDSYSSFCWNDNGISYSEDSDCTF